MPEKKKELNEETLEKVTGGSDSCIPKTHGRHIGKYEAEHYIGSKVYCVWDQKPEAYVVGILKRSWEDSWGCGTRRVHEIDVLELAATKYITLDYYNGEAHGPGKHVYCGDAYTLYLYE